MAFKEAVEETPNLQGKWKAGLGALRPADKLHIHPEKTATTHLRGSVDIDTAWVRLDPQGNRWDFAIGYKHDNRSDEYVYWVETHPGSDGQIGVMLAKLAWLKNWLNGPGKRLAAFEKIYVWVPSDHTSFTRGSTQVKQLAEKGVFYTGSTFKIPANHRAAKK